ncbi:MAG: non-homologous end-joining DNA ligase [Rhodothalassiaceae bacterium]
MRMEGIALSSPDKELFPQITKRAVADYYRRVAPQMLPHIDGRPLTLKRFPEGVARAGFFNKRVPRHFPDFVERVILPLRSKAGTIAMAAADEAADLIYFAGQNTVEIHMGLAQATRPDCPDQIVLDFDPSDTDFEKVRVAALGAKAMLEGLGLPALVKTTGGRGVHVHVPLQPETSFDEVKHWAYRLAQALNSRLPKITTLEHRKAKRGEKVFIDYLRNDFAQTVIAPYSLRARPEAPVAAPITWAELRARSLTPGRYRLDNLFRRLAQREDPWAAAAQLAVSAEQVHRAMASLEGLA